MEATDNEQVYTNPDSFSTEKSIVNPRLRGAIMPWNNTLTIDGIRFTFVEHDDETKGILVPPDQELDENYIALLEIAQGYWDHLNSFAYLINMRGYWYYRQSRHLVDKSEVMYHAMKFLTQDDLHVPDWVNEFVEHVRNDEPVFPPLPTPQRPKLKSEKPGFVYLLKSNTNHYKIGRTVDPDSRSKTFGIQLPFDVEFVCTIKTDNMKKLEDDLHLKYADKRVNGEWFNLTTDDIEYIKGLAS